MEYIKLQIGCLTDPVLVDIFLEEREKVEEVYKQI